MVLSGLVGRGQIEDAAALNAGFRVPEAAAGGLIRPSAPYNLAFLRSDQHAV